ncbi:MAG: hypothetical protein ACLQKA_02990 [Bryobacteraceae bacterium]
MAKTKVSHKLSHVNNKAAPLGWDAVIADAEEEIHAISARKTALKASLRLFRQKNEEGEPLPQGLSAQAARAGSNTRRGRELRNLSS